MVHLSVISEHDNNVGMVNLSCSLSRRERKKNFFLSFCPSPNKILNKIPPPPLCAWMRQTREIQVHFLITDLFLQFELIINVTK